MTRKTSQKTLSKAFKNLLEEIQQDLDFIKDKSTDDPNIAQIFYQLGMLQGYATGLQEKIDAFKKQVHL